MLRSARLLTRLARFVAGEAAPPARVRVQLSRERRPTALRPVGEGSAAHAQSPHDRSPSRAGKGQGLGLPARPRCPPARSTSSCHSRAKRRIPDHGSGEGGHREAGAEPLMPLTRRLSKSTSSRAGGMPRREHSRSVGSIAITEPFDRVDRPTENKVFE